MIPWLSDVSVLALSTGIAGGYCARLLRSLGARVQKVELPEGDPLRGRVAGALFEHLYQGVERITLDPDAAVDRERLQNAITASDIVIDGDDTGRALAWPADRLRAALARAPRLVRVSISPFGADGPWTGRAASEFTLQGWCASMGLRGAQDSPPLAAAGSLGAWATGAMSALAAVSFLRASRRAGCGYSVDVSMLESMTLLWGTPALELQLRGSAGPAPRVDEIPSIVEAADGYVGFALVTAQQWQDFCVLVERPEWRDEPELARLEVRKQRRVELMREVEAWTGRHTVDEIVERAALFRIPVAPVSSGATVADVACYRERASFGPIPGTPWSGPRAPFRVRSVTDATQARATTANVSADGAPLEGIRVTDLTAFWAGPFASCLLAQLGAEVIHVESVRRPDGMRFRSSQPPGADRWWEWSGIFHAVNAGKQSVTLDLDRPEGRQLVERLIGRSDLVIENYSPRVMETFGLDAARLRTLRQDLVAIRMPAFGLEGSWRDRPGFQQTVEQASGLAWITGWPDDRPRVPYVSDATAGVHAALAAVAALTFRDRTGHGAHVEVPLADVGVNLAAEPYLEWALTGHAPMRLGNADAHRAPRGVYRCRAAGPEAAWLALAIDTDTQWESLRRLLGDPAWARAPELQKAAGRVARRDALEAHLCEWFAQRGRDEQIEQLWAAGVPVAAVQGAPRPVSPWYADRSVLRRPLASTIGVCSSSSWKCPRRSSSAGRKRGSSESGPPGRRPSDEAGERSVGWLARAW
jgi:crotonobetainyl-CoA:carnitine CoA-transferase CaiB-like acyl-CoA transferase